MSDQNSEKKWTEEEIAQLELDNRSRQIAIIVAGFLTLAIFVVQAFVLHQPSYGLFSIFFVVQAVYYTCRAVRLKTKTDIWLSITSTLVTVLSLITYVLQVIEAMSA